MTVVAPTRRRRLVVTGIWAASTAGAVALVLATLPLSGDEIDVTFMLAMTALAVDVEIFASVGAVLAIRRPGNLVGYVLMAAAALMAVTFCGFVFGAGFTLINGPNDLTAGLASLVGGLTIFPGLVVAGPALALVFPDGRLPGHRWRWAIAVIVSMLTIGLLLAAVRPGPVNDGLAVNPLGIPGDDWTQWGGLGLLVSGLALVASLILGIVAVVVRYRRGSGVERAQLRWFLAANVTTAILLSLSFLDGSSGSPTIIDILGVLSLGLPPIAVGIAVMRYRLYEIDRIISRTIAYGVVTAILAAVYASRHPRPPGPARGLPRRRHDLGGVVNAHRRRPLPADPKARPARGGSTLRQGSGLTPSARWKGSPSVSAMRSTWSGSGRPSSRRRTTPCGPRLRQSGSEPRRGPAMTMIRAAGEPRHEIPFARHFRNNSRTPDPHHEARDE